MKTFNRFKDVFFTSDEPQVAQFPSGEKSVNEAIVPAQNIQDVLQTYEQEFEKLNLQGPDFFEFLKAISKIPDADAKTYQVIQATLDLDKRTLLENAKFYVDKLTEICNGSKATLNDKILATATARKEETADLLKQANDLESQIMALQGQKDVINSTLKSINDKHLSVEQELNNYIQANDLAKTTIVDRINNVVEGIKSNIK